MRALLAVGLALGFAAAPARAAQPTSYDLTCPIGGCVPRATGSVPPAGAVMGRSLWDGVTPCAPQDVQGGLLVLVPDAAQASPLWVDPAATANPVQSQAAQGPQIVASGGGFALQFPDGSTSAPMPAATAASALSGSFDPAGAAATEAARAKGVEATIPQPITSTPPAPTPTGMAGTGGIYVPGNASPPGLTRATTVTTGTDGTFSVTWATPFVSTAPDISPVPVNAGTQPIVCNVTSRSASTAAAGRPRRSS